MRLFAPGGQRDIRRIDNSLKWWDNTEAAHLGFRPKDTADEQRERVEASSPALDPADPARIFQGGVFVRAGPFDD